MSRHEIADGLVDQLLAGYERPQDLTGPDGLLAELTKRLVERALGAELTAELGYEAGERPPAEQSNRRNGTSPKTLVTTQGALRIAAPRDRAGSFEPKLVKKHQRRFDGFDEKIVALYAGGMTTRDIQRHLQELYGVEVSPELVSKVTDAVLEDVREWQARPLEQTYAIVYLDALVVKIRSNQQVRNRHAYLVIGVDCDGRKDTLGIWLSPERGEAAGFWASVLVELRNRGVDDILIACCDGLSGFPEAIERVYPKTTVQTCIVHMVRASLRYVSYQDRKKVAADLRRIYAAATVEAAELELSRVAERWDARYPKIAAQWLDAWERVIPFLAFPPELRRVVYTTNAIESLHSTIRKTLKTRGHFPNEEAALKLIYLAIQRVQAKWRNPSPWWPTARQALETLYGERVPLD